MAQKTYAYIYDESNAVLISEFDTSFDSVGCNSLTEFLFGVPNFGSSEA